MINVILVSLYFLISFIVVEKLAPEWVKKNKDLNNPNLKEIIKYRIPFFCLVPFRAWTYKDKYKAVRIFGYIVSFLSGPVFFLTTYLFIYMIGYGSFVIFRDIYRTLKEL